MILRLSQNHGYNERGIQSFEGLLGTDITFEQFADLARRVEMWVYQDGDEPNTIYVAHPHSF